MNATNVIGLVNRTRHSRTRVVEDLIKSAIFRPITERQQDLASGPAMRPRRRPQVAGFRGAEQVVPRLESPGGDGLRVVGCQALFAGGGFQGCRNLCHAPILTYLASSHLFYDPQIE